MGRRGTRLTLCSAVMVVAGCGGQAAERQSAPGRLPPARGILTLSAFRAEVFARGLNRPTALAWSPSGRLYATQESGEVVRVPRRSGRPRVVASGFRTPLGLAWKGRTLFVSAQGGLWRIRKGRRTAIVSGLPYGLHQQDNVVVGPAGRLYFGSGSTCNACRERSRLSATVLSVRPDGSGLRVVARGMRNPFGLAFDRRTGRLFASVNARDDVPAPAESIVRIEQGKNFGWPDCWPSWRLRKLVGRCAGVARHAAYLQPHSSADGIVFYRGRSFGRRYRGDLFVAEWGEYYSRAHGRRVEHVELSRDGNPRNARVRIFAKGFEHPLALAVDRLGALLVADHGRGIVYRIQRRGRP